MKSPYIDNVNAQKYQKNPKYCSFENLQNSSFKMKLSYQGSPQIKNNKNANNKFHFNKKININTNLNILTNSNIYINSILNNPKFHKNKSQSKYNLYKKAKKKEFKNGSHFQSSNHNHSYININKFGKKIILCVDAPQNLKDINELNISNVKNNVSQLTEQNNNITSCFETNISSDINNNNNKNQYDYFSLNKRSNSINKANFSQSNSLNNTVSNSNGKKNNIVNINKIDNKILFYQYQKKNKKEINKNNNIHNFTKNETYTKSLNKYHSSYSSLNNSKKKSKSKSNILIKDTNLTPYNYKLSKKNFVTKPIIKNSSQNKKPIIIKNNNSIIFKNKEKIDVQITSINNLLNNKFIKEINNIQVEMDRNIKLNQANSRNKKYNTIKQFFEKFLKILNEYLNKNSFNCIYIFLQKVINGYHEIVTSFSSENKAIQKQNIKLNKKIEEIQKMVKESEKKINLLQQKNIELSNQIKIIKSQTCENNNYIDYIDYDIYKKNTKKFKSEEKIIMKEQNHKIFKLNEKNLDDLDALYFFDKINMNCKQSSSRGIPLIPIEEYSEDSRKKTYSKKLSEINNKYFLEIKKAFE